MADQNNPEKKSAPGAENESMESKETEKKPETDPSQNPLKSEIDKSKGDKQPKSRKEKLLFTQKRIAQQLRELEEEDGMVLDDDIDDNTPVTFGVLKQLKLKEAEKTALDKAEAIEDEREREEVKYHLQNNIRSTGNPEKDLQMARALANASKNAAIAEEASRKSKAKGHSGSTSAPAKTEDNFEPTAEERVLMSAPWNLSKEEILKARRKSASREE